MRDGLYLELPIQRIIAQTFSQKSRSEPKLYILNKLLAST